MTINATNASGVSAAAQTIFVTDGETPPVTREVNSVYVTDEEGHTSLVFTRPALPQLTDFTANLFQARSLITPDATATQGDAHTYAWRDTRWPASPRLDLRFTYTGATSVSFRQYPDGMADANIPVTSSNTTFATASFAPAQTHTRVVATATNAEGSVSRELHIYYWSPPTLTVRESAFQLPIGNPPIQTQIVDLFLTRGGSPLPAASTFTMTASDGSRTYDLTRHFRQRAGQQPPLTDRIRLTRAVTGTITHVTYGFACSNTVPGATTSLTASASESVTWP